MVAVLAVVTAELSFVQPMASASLPVQEAPAHFTPAGRSTEPTEGDGEDLAPSCLPPPRSVRKNTAPMTTSTPTAPARNIVSRRRPAPEEEPPPGRGASGGSPYGLGVSGVRPGSSDTAGSP